MGGYEIVLVGIGILFGNLGAIIVKPVNLGIFGNSVIGVAGAFIAAKLPGLLNVALFIGWRAELAAAAGCAFIFMIAVGALNELRYR